MSTQLAREREENARLAEEETDFERIVSMGLGPLDALDPEQEVRPALHCLKVLASTLMSRLAVEVARPHKVAAVPVVLISNR